MRRLLRPRNLVLSLVVLIGLGVAGAFGALWWAEARVERELVERAERYGWTLTLAEVDVTFAGDVRVTGLEAHDALGGRVVIERIETRLTPRELWDGRRVPEAVDLYGLEAFLTRGGLEALAERRSASSRGEDGGGAGGASLPTVRLHQANVALATGTSLGVVRVAGARAELGRETSGEQDETSWRFAGEATLELDRSHRMSFALTAVPARRWGHAQVSFETPVVVRERGVGTVSLSALDLAGSPESIAGNLQGIAIEPELKLGLVELTIAQVDLALGRRADGRWWPLSLRVVEPQATLDLTALLEGPLGQRYPRLVEVANVAARHLTGEPLLHRRPQQRPIAGALAMAPRVGAGQSGSPRDRSSASGADSGPAGERSAGGRGGSGLGQVRALLAELPGILVEDGALELVAGERRLRIRGLGFDTSALRDGAGGSRSYAFGMNLRGARADVRVDVPDGAAWPSGSVRIRDLSAADLFAVADLRPPRELAGELDFDLEVSRAEQGELVVRGGVAVRGFGFFHPKVSTRALRNIDASLTGTLRYDLERDTLRLEEIAATSGPLTAYAELGVTALRSDPDISYRFWGEDLACEAIPAAIPDGLLPTIEALAIAPGRMSPVVEGRLRWSQPHSFEMKISDLPGECRPTSVAPHDVMALNDDDYTFTFLGLPYTWQPEGVTVGPGTRDWVALEALPSYVPAAMFLTEDKRFFDHPGLRLGLIERAVKLNLEHRRYVYGGSSISQQLVKNLFLTRTKTLARKLEEVLIVWAMEWEVPKQRILELYLNCIEFGPDIYGVVQASRFYFDKRPEQLTPLEAGYLASLKVAPRRGGKFYKEGFPGPGRWWHKRQRYIQVTLSENGYISPAEAIAGYPYMPPFDHPQPGDASDSRTWWLERHGGHPFDD